MLREFVPELNAGGVEGTTLEVAQALIAQGHTAHVVSAGGRMEDDFLAMGGRLHKVDIGSKNIFSVFRRIRLLRAIIHEHKIDIVHARSRAPAWPAYYAAKIEGVPFLTTYHGIYNSRSYLKTFYNSVMAKGVHIIANSEFTKPGRLTRWKGSLVAIEALAQLPEDCVLVLMGDAQGRDDFVTEIDAKAAEHGVSSRVIKAGHSRDVPTALAAADVVMSASTDPEAFGRVAAEAQAMQKPVIATAHGGALETVIDGETGFLVTPSDAEALAEGIRKALDWPDYDGSAAHSRILKHFSTKSLQAKTLQVYKDLLK